MRHDLSLDGREGRICPVAFATLFRLYCLYYAPHTPPCRGFVHLVASDLSCGHEWIRLRASERCGPHGRHGDGECCRRAIARWEHGFNNRRSTGA